MKIFAMSALFGLVCLVSGRPQYFQDSGEEGWSWGSSSGEESQPSRDQQIRPNQPSLPRPNRPNPPSGTGSIVSPTRQPLSNVPDTTAIVGITTEPTEEFSRCFDACPSTAQYNPVCGSDMQSYHNMARFDCAVSCGANIRVLFAGTCVPVSG
ncbi:uncharacterized protein LOC132259707 [Phlebotomus argentipes]|uniref:uncharacterized protein LOC132259707 n=1 Tax=Phlebotomus argentipes TaxID=94469 RepID=UPI00289309F6|nr:uncharacterized protein LOC132259707 [Phlebotomus argentipes]